MIETVTGVILAGGKSTRMGRNKALLPLRGKTLVECVLETMQGIFSRILVSVNPEDPYANISIQKVVDRYPETGPLGGITSVLEAGESRIFCAACDMPFLNKALIAFLCGFVEYDAVIPVWEGKAEVLHAFYSGTLLPAFRSALQQQHYRITDALQGANVRFVNNSEIRQFDPEGVSFRNLNTPADYEQVLGQLRDDGLPHV